MVEERVNILSITITTTHATLVNIIGIYPLRVANKIPRTKFIAPEINLKYLTL